MTWGQTSPRPGASPELPGGGADAHKLGDGQPERGWVDLHPVSGDHAGPLETLHSFGDRWGGHFDPARQRRHRDPRVGVQLGQQLHVHRVQQLPKSIVSRLVISS
jgi:hypothetical protein